MLVLSRRPGELIRIGEDIYVRIIRIKGKQVRLGIEAPRAIQVERIGEDQFKKEIKEAKQ